MTGQKTARQLKAETVGTQRQEMKKRPLIILMVLGILVVSAGAFLSRKTLTIEKGFKVENYKEGSLVYNVWSYGNWHERWKGNLHISTYDPPYSFVFAISDVNNDMKSIEILDVKLCRNNICQQIGRNLDSKKENVVKRDNASIKLPYAVFLFKDVIPNAEEHELFIEFTDNKGQKHKTAIKLAPFESKKKGIYVWEVMMGV